MLNHFELELKSSIKFLNKHRNVASWLTIIGLSSSFHNCHEKFSEVINHGCTKSERQCNACQIPIYAG